MFTKGDFIEFDISGKDNYNYGIVKDIVDNNVVINQQGCVHNGIDYVEHRERIRNWEFDIAEGSMI